ncbi:MAG: PIN domain-containing protein [Nitrospirae bacterium]|nr:PIN domain-containing protein [Nitrospirota bacterium]
MPINYTIHANIVDINADTPKLDDLFLVDTNVWFWMTYSKVTSNAPKQWPYYPAYLNKALATGSSVRHVGLSLAELAHIIERTEREIYNKTHKKKYSDKEAKAYRHNLAAERTRVAAEIKTAWLQVENLAIPLNQTIDAVTVTSALNRIQTENVDGYDLFILESMKAHGVIKVITDDGDFATVSGIEVFTANRNVINAASAQGKVIVR